MHTVIIRVIKDTLRFLFSMFRIEKDILFTSATFVLIKVLKTFPLWFWDIFIELFLCFLS